jgi:hypothetical protein
LKRLDWYEVKTPMKYMISKIVIEISYDDDNNEAKACGTGTGERPTVQSGQE